MTRRFAGIAGHVNPCYPWRWGGYNQLRTWHCGMVTDKMPIGMLENLQKIQSKDQNTSYDSVAADCVGSGIPSLSLKTEAGLTMVRLFSQYLRSFTLESDVSFLKALTTKASGNPRCQSHLLSQQLRSKLDRPTLSGALSIILGVVVTTAICTHTLVFLNVQSTSDVFFQRLAFPWICMGCGSDSLGSLHTCERAFTWQG